MCLSVCLCLRFKETVKNLEILHLHCPVMLGVHVRFCDVNLKVVVIDVLEEVHCCLLLQTCTAGGS